MSRHIILSLRHRLGALDRDEQGTTLTEFVITLPIFIVIFFGVLNLGKLHRDGQGVHFAAYQQMWTRVIPVQRTRVNAKHMQTTVAAATSASLLANAGFSLGNVQEGAKLAGMGLTGHFGESYALAIPLEAAGAVNYKLPGDGKVKKKVSELTTSGNVQALVNDGLSKPNFRGTGALAAANSLLSATGARPAIAAGIRYGMVEGRAETSGNLLSNMGSYDMSARYDVLVSPYAHTSLLEHTVTVAMARFTVEDCQLFGSTLGVQRSNVFKNQQCSSGGSGGGGF